MISEACICYKKFYRANKPLPHTLKLCEDKSSYSDQSNLIWMRMKNYDLQMWFKRIDNGKKQSQVRMTSWNRQKQWAIIKTDANAAQRTIKKKTEKKKKAINTYLRSRQPSLIRRMYQAHLSNEFGFCSPAFCMQSRVKSVVRTHADRNMC